MKHLITLTATMFIFFGSYGQRIELSAIAGGTYSIVNNDYKYQGEKGRINPFGGLEIKYHIGKIFIVGAGCTVENLSWSFKKNAVDTNAQPLGEKTFVAHVGSPAYTPYAILGLHIKSGTFVIQPQIIAGMAFTQKTQRNDKLRDLPFENGKGYMYGLQVNVGKEVSDMLSVGITAGIKYYKIDHDGVLDLTNKMFTIPIGVVASLRL